MIGRSLPPSHWDRRDPACGRSAASPRTSSTATACVPSSSSPAVDVFLGLTVTPDGTKQRIYEPPLPSIKKDKRMSIEEKKNELDQRPL